MMKRYLALLLAAVMLLGLGSFSALAEQPLTISLYYADNATLPFREDWPMLQHIQEKYNVKLAIEPIPIADYATKVGLALSTGQNAPGRHPQLQLSRPERFPRAQRRDRPHQRLCRLDTQLQRQGKRVWPGKQHRAAEAGRRQALLYALPV